MGSIARAVHTSCSTAAAGNTQDVTVSGETRTPVCAIFHISGTTSADTWTNDHVQGYGATDGTNQFGGTFYSDDASGFTAGDVRYNTDCVLSLLTGGSTGAEEMRFSFNSFIAGGVRLDIDVAASSAWLFQVFFYFEGDFEVGTHSSSSSLNGTASQTGMGFDPDWLHVFEWGNFGFTTSIGGAARCSVGFVADDGSGVDQCSLSWFSRDGVTTSQTAARVSQLYGSGWFTQTSTTQTFLEYDLISGGFQTTVRLAAQQHHIGYVACRMDDITPWTGLFQYPTATTGDHDVTEPTVEAVVGFVIMDVLRPASIDTFNTGAASVTTGMGWWTGDEEMCISGLDEDNRGTSDTATYADDNKMISYGVATGTTKSAATFVTSLSTTGLTINITPAETQNRSMPMLVLSPKPQVAILDEVVQISDELLPAREWRRLLDGETVQLEDEPVAVAGRNAVLDELVELIDDPIAVAGRNAVLDEVVEISDELRRIRGVNAIVDEAIDITDELIQITEEGRDRGGARRGRLTFAASEASQLRYPQSVASRLTF